jgi:hypothetical protein
MIATGRQLFFGESDTEKRFTPRTVLFAFTAVA